MALNMNPLSPVCLGCVSLPGMALHPGAHPPTTAGESCSPGGGQDTSDGIQDGAARERNTKFSGKSAPVESPNASWLVPRLAPRLNLNLLSFEHDTKFLLRAVPGTKSEAGAVKLNGFWRSL